MKASPQTARRLRRNQTNAERILWFRLRDRRLNGWKFKRQFPIDRYIVDFFCADAHLIIELDGGQHAVRTDSDAQRSKILEAMGYLVLRFWDNDVMRNLEGVLAEIYTALETHRSEIPITSPRRGEVERAQRARARGFGSRSLSQASEPPHPNPLPFGERVELACEPNASDRPRRSLSQASDPPHPNPLPCGEREYSKLPHPNPLSSRERE